MKSLICFGIAFLLLSSSLASDANPPYPKAFSDLKESIVKGLGFTAEDDIKITGFDPREAQVGHSVEEHFDCVTCPPNCYSGFSEHDRSNRLFAVHLPSLPASVVRLTGAGDCLVGGTLSSICAGLDIMRSVSVGIAAAKAAVEVESNVPSAFSLTAFAGHCDTQVSIASFQAGKMKMLSHAFYTSLGAYFLRYQLESNQSIFMGSNSLTWQMIYIGSYYFSLVFRLKQILDQPESDT